MNSMTEPEINYQCWICPFCYDDHWSDGSCKEKDLKDEITRLRAALAEATKDLE